MTQGYKEYIRVQREKRIEATLPAPMGEEATAALGPIKQETTDLANRLGLVQAGLAMAAAGKTRATVSQVADMALNEYGVLVMPSVAGQIFSEFGVRRVSVHGERRLVLQAEQLKPLHDDLSADIERLQPQIEEATKRFEGLAERVNELRVRVCQIRHKAELDKKLREFIVKYERDPRTMASLEQQCRAVSAKMDRGDKQEAKEALQAGRDVKGPGGPGGTVRRRREGPGGARG